MTEFLKAPRVKRKKENNNPQTVVNMTKHANLIVAPPPYTPNEMVIDNFLLSKYSPSTCKKAQDDDILKCVFINLLIS